MIMKNNLSDSKTDAMSTSWTVYKINCPCGDCELPNPSYIGQTRTPSEHASNNTPTTEP